MRAENPKPYDPENRSIFDPAFLGVVAAEGLRRIAGSARLRLGKIAEVAGKLPDDPQQIAVMRAKLGAEQLPGQPR